MGIDFQAIILAGGSGSRLWPVSRMSYPKQFCELLDDTLLNKTIARLLPFGKPLLLTSKKLAPLSERALEENELPKNSLLIEPEAKNTAAAMAYLCQILKDQPDTVIGVFPSDHWVEETKNFEKDIQAAVALAKKSETLVLIGIPPTYAATSYGYIETEAEEVKSFIEKPAQSQANALIKKPHILWNSGIFILTVKSLKKAFEDHSPQFLTAFENQSAEEAFKTLPTNSFDYEIVEKLKNIKCLKASFKWSDLGSWDQLVENYGGSLAKTYEVNAQNNTAITSRTKSTGFIGVDDILVVDTKDALLIAKKGQGQKVKDLVEVMLASNDRRAIDPVKELRNWGEFSVLEEEDNFKVKKVKVLPGKAISYQSHKNRQEHWILLKGEAEVVLDGITHNLKKGESIFVKSNVKHLIRCISEVPLELIEVQTGSYFGEDDIQRFES